MLDEDKTQKLRSERGREGPIDSLVSLKLWEDRLKQVVYLTPKELKRLDGDIRQLWGEVDYIKESRISKLETQIAVIKSQQKALPKIISLIGGALTLLLLVAAYYLKGG